MPNGKDLIGLHLRGFMIVGNSIPYFHMYYHDLNLKYSKEVDDLEIINSEIKELIKKDILDAIENQLKEDKHSKPEKWIKKIFVEGLL